MTKMGKMLSEKQRRELAKNLCIRGMRLYIQKFREEEDLINGEEKRLIIEEMESIIADLKEDKTAQYKRRAERAEATLERWRELEDCDEEFEI